VRNEAGQPNAAPTTPVALDTAQKKRAYLTEHGYKYGTEEYREAVSQLKASSSKALFTV
jgi:hypothetical protein